VSPAIDDLITLAGPLGPFGTDEQQGVVRSRLMSGAATVAAERILDAVQACPPLPVNVPREDFEFVASDLLAGLGEDPSVMERLVLALEEPAVRKVAIEALALLANADVAEALAALVTRELATPFLTEDETIHLASALGAVGGVAALAAIEALRAKPVSEAVRRELDIALQMLGAST
jgi:hypothetical protein